MIWLSGFLVAIGVLVPVAVFVGYPLALLLASRLQRETPVAAATSGLLPSVTLVVVARNAAALVTEKLRNFQSLDYPPRLLELVLFSDGSEDDTVALVRKFGDERIRLLVSADHVGKFTGLNRAVAAARNDLLVFSDVDAHLTPDALSHLVRPLADPVVGGVCGQRLLRRECNPLAAAQGSYIDFDSRIKQLESRIGSITSNDGKLYAIRRELFTPVPGGVTDDLFQSLGVIGQGRRFLFEPRAIATITVPSRNPAHEVRRRRRIVARSLRSLWFHRRLLNPFHSGWYAVGLGVNKGWRRLLPLALGGLPVGAAGLAASGIPAWWGVVVLLGAGLAAGLLQPVLCPPERTGGALGRLLGKGRYVLLGLAGTHLGLMDFLRGRVPDRWDPVKQG
ncbi:MAG: glycosyltransferase [Magnetococcales bacterium]|nr:glycosyltransferase [Magnetococcales bacterium]